MGKGDTHQTRAKKNKFVKNDMVFANTDEGEFYAKVQGILNGNRIKVKDINGSEYQIIIRGNFWYGPKKEKVTFPDADRHEYWVLVQPGITANQYFLKHIYNDIDCQNLKDRGELSVTVTTTNIIQHGMEEDEIEDNGEDWIDNI
jgi:hypothetical protein